MNQPTSTRNVRAQSGRSWQTRDQNAQPASPRSLTTSPYTTRRVALENEPKEKEGEKGREAATLVESFHKPWLRPSGDFIPAPELGRPPGGGSPVIHYFVEQETGMRWIGKVGQVPLRDKEVIEAARRLPGFLGVYADEILEKLGLCIYQLVGTEVPQSALSYQRVTMEAMHPDMLLAMQLNAEDEERVFELPHSPRMHHLSRYVDEFQPLEPDFVQEYIVKAKSCGKEYVKIKTRAGELMPLQGLGGMLAAADFVYDLDCLGDSCGNAGYVIREDAATGERYAQLVKIDAGYAFSYSNLRTDQSHNPKDRQIRVAPNQLRLQFADLAPADQKEFAAAAKRILATPYEEFAQLFAQTEELKEGLSIEHWLDLLNGLIARKSLFLKAFAAETDRTIVKEIEEAQAKIAKKLERTEEVSPQAVEELLEQEKEESKALAELRVRLAVVDAKESDPKKVGECKTFQLPAVTTHFVGRERALVEVTAALNQQCSGVIGQSISGIGGVGKTQLALHYATAAANGEKLAGKQLAYEYVVWLNAEVFLEGQFQAMVEVWLGRHCKADEAVEEVYAFLRDKRTLLVFDNAESARFIEGFLPPPDYGSPVHLLITSRNAQWGMMPTVKLGGFTLEEAIEYVEHHLGPQSKEAVVKLVELLEGLPLAMSQVVSYIKAGHSTLEDYEQQFYLNQTNLLSHELISEESHPKTVGTTLTLSLAQAKVRSELAEQVLGVVAYLAPESIEIELIVQALNSSKEAVMQALEILENYSLLSMRGKLVQVHRLVQEVMRHRHKFLSKPQAYWETVVALLKKIIKFDNTNLEEMRSCSHAIAHVQQLAKLSKIRTLDKEEEKYLALLLDSSGRHQETMGAYAIARTFQEQVLEWLEREYGTAHPDVAITVGILGGLYGNLGNANKQKELLGRALKIFLASYGPDHPDVARTLLNLGNAYGDLGEVNASKEYYENALDIAIKHNVLDRSEVSKLMTNLGITYCELGDADKSRELLEWAVSIKEEVYGQNHPEVAITLENLAIAYLKMGALNKSKELHKRALLINERHYGPNHPKVANTLGNLSNIYRVWGNVLKQKELLERALLISEGNYGSNHRQVADTLILLGNVYSELKDFDKSNESYERAICIKEHIYGGNHIEFAKTLAIIGNEYNIFSNNATKCVKLCERALAILESQYGFNHIEVASILLSLGAAYGELGDPHKEKKLRKRAVTILTRHYGPDHPMVVMKILASLKPLKKMNEKRDFVIPSSIEVNHSDGWQENVSEKKDFVLPSILNVDHLYGSQENASEQKERLEQMLIIYEHRYGSHHPNVGIILGALGEIYGELGDVNKKKELLERSLVVLEQHYGPNHDLIVATLNNLGNTYGVLGDIFKKKDLLERALSVSQNLHGPDHPDVAGVLMNLGNAYGAFGDACKAKELLERALIINERHYGFEHIRVATTLVNLGIIYGNLQEASKHIELLRHAVKLNLQHYGPDHLETAKALFNLSNAFGELKDLYRQKELLEGVCIIRINNLGPDHAIVEETLAGLRRVYDVQEKETKAMEIAELALTTVEYDRSVIKLFDLGVEYGKEIGKAKRKELETRAGILSKLYYGNYQSELAMMLFKMGQIFSISASQFNSWMVVDHTRLLEKIIPLLSEHCSSPIQIAKSLVSLSKAYGDVGELSMQRELLKRALGTIEQYFGPEHPLVAPVLFASGSVPCMVKDVRGQRKLLENALSIFKNHYGSDHPDVGITYVHLANANDALGDVGKKKELLERALSILSQYYGADHITVAQVLRQLGSTYGELRDVDKQKELSERALNIFENYYGPNHISLVMTLLELSAAYRDLDNLGKQRDYLERVLTIFEHHHGPNHPDVANMLLNLGAVYGRLGDLNKKRDLLERSLAIDLQNFGPDHLNVARVSFELGKTYGELGDISKQIELLELALIINQCHLGPEHVEVAKISSQLSKAYSQIQQPELLEGAHLIGEYQVSFDSPDEMPDEILKQIEQIARGDESYPNMKVEELDAGCIEESDEMKEDDVAFDSLGEASEPAESIGAMNIIEGTDDLQCSEVENILVARLAQAQLEDSNVKAVLEIAAYLGTGNIPEHLLAKIVGLEEAGLRQALSVLEKYLLLNYNVMKGVMRINGEIQEAILMQHKREGVGAEYREKIVKFLCNVIVYDSRNMRVMEDCSDSIEYVVELGRIFTGIQLDEKEKIALAKLLNMSGKHQYAMGNHETSRKLYEQAVELFDNIYGLEHPLVATALINLSNTVGELGNALKKKQLLERALKIEEKHYGDMHPRVGRVLVNLANAMGSLGENMMKKELLEKGLMILEGHYGAEHPEVAITLTNLGDVVRVLGDAEKGKKMLTRALAIQESYYESEHPQLGVTLYNMACACKQLGEKREAVEYGRRAWRQFDKYYGPEHPNTIEACQLLG